jgi:2-desacetyl-2-hydroxyethyl bacteriochlorophyllide A dehydrogenase
MVFPAANTVELESFDLGDPAEGEVSVRTICSLISTGTEGIVLQQNFSPDTSWAGYGRLPFHPGYAAVGVVERAGPGAVSLLPGDVVALRRGHASNHVVPVSECFPVPEGLAPEDAVWFALAWIGFRGFQAAGVSLGDDVLVAGAGPIGQMLLRWCAVAGARRVVVVDPLAERLTFARRGGATIVVDRPVHEAAAQIEKTAEVSGIVADTTGNAAVFRSLLRIAPRYGRIVLLGDTGHPEDQRLTQDVVLKGLTVVGAHDGHEREGRTGAWVTSLFFDLLVARRFPVDDLITHRFAPADAPEAYALTTNRREETMGVLFDWSPTDSEA